LKEKTLMATIKNTEIKTSEKFPIVGIGASAGGLAAFESFFSGMPADDTNMAFIIIQHLAPDHKSILTEIIQRYTRMKVFEAQDGMQVQANCTYVIPPNYDMAILNNTLMLLKPTQPHGQRLPIDFFFRSLAQDQHQNAIGIILSGTGHDGTNGIKAIKQEGGLVIAQNPDFAEFNSMPKSAIETGIVDYELSPDAMPSEIIKYLTLRPYTSPKIHTAAHNSEILNKIFILIRNQTTHDFSMYKPSTIGRRIERRMMVNQIETMFRRRN
jgi:two-component system CheB/CheR fusion protein